MQGSPVEKDYMKTIADLNKTAKKAGK